jgi:hypothetical protein
MHFQNSSAQLRGNAFAFFDAMKVQVSLFKEIACKSLRRGPAKIHSVLLIKLAIEGIPLMNVLLFIELVCAGDDGF